MNATAQPRAIEEIGIFLPPPARVTLVKAVDLLESANVEVDKFIEYVLHIGDTVIGGGLEWSVDRAEALIDLIYTSGTMEKLGSINPFLRDGAEIGIQLGLNTLKSLTPADVAKIVGLAIIAFTVPNLLLLNGPDFLDIVVQLLTKLWNLP